MMGWLFSQWGGLCWAQSLTVADVQKIIAQAADRAAIISPDSVIAVTDREGFVLVVWDVNGGSAPSDAIVAAAISKAGTAAFLSSDQHAFTSRTAGFIVQQNFPPGIDNRPPGPLVGVPFSSLPHSDVNFFKRITGAASFEPIVGTRLVGAPGGVPLYKNGVLVGGVGVTVDPATELIALNPPITGESICDVLLDKSSPAQGDLNKENGNLRSDENEEVALAGQFGFTPLKKIFGTRVFIDGIRVPYISKSKLSKQKQLAQHDVPFGGSTPGNELPLYPFRDSPAFFVFPDANLGGVDGQVRSPIIDDPLIGDPTLGTLNGVARLTAAEVMDILTLAAQRSVITRAQIRLPRGSPARVFISVVSNPGTNGVAPAVLGTFRTTDATIFSWDVSVQKARTAVYFSKMENLTNTQFTVGTDVAFSTRAVGFLSQCLFPPGIEETQPGPFSGMQVLQFSNPGSTNAPDPNLPNGITIFPGGFPLYRNGQLIGAIGISGDGVDQDDIIGASGTVDYLPPDAIRSDKFEFRGARLPYAKFPRDPGL